MSDQPSDKSFVQSWTEAENKDHPDSKIVKAIAKFTAEDELNEAKLLAVLKAMAKPSGEEDS